MSILSEDRPHRRATRCYPAAVSELRIGNPRARWLSFVVTGVAIGLVGLIILAASGPDQCTTDDGQTCGGGMTGLIWLFLFAPFCLGFLLTAFFSARAYIVLSAEGIRVRALFENKTYRWDQITNVEKRYVRHRVNLIPTGTSRSLHISLDNGRSVELPAPHAATFIGRPDFEASSDIAWRAWRSAPAPAPRPTDRGRP
jgi:hypothetical protein